jgi:hypothetical protein
MSEFDGQLVRETGAEPKTFTAHDSTHPMFGAVVELWDEEDQVVGSINVELFRNSGLYELVSEG